MNYLAHLYLSHDNAELMIGSILGDFVKGSIHHLYTPEIRKGIQLHRQIDSYTDTHQIVHVSKRIVTDSRRRFAGIMVDLFYDHFLAQQWSTYSSVPLYDFSQQVYRVLLEHQDILPARLIRILPYMIEENWLTSYQDINHIGKALNGISRRLKRQNTLLNSVEELESNYAAFETYFQTFFPDVIDFVKQCKQLFETL
ncbi:MAG TPA: ACP phosphodiesterase [Crinalium sp.]|jgi:acyl carrier protein phosphodiesterase